MHGSKWYIKSISTWVQNLIPKYGSMIVAAERYSKEDLCRLLTAAHMIGLYGKSTRSSNLIGLLGNASSREDLLPSWSEFFFQISKIFLKIEDELLEEIKRWKKDREETIFSFLFFSSQILRIKTPKTRFCADPKKEDSPPLFHAKNQCPKPLTMENYFSSILHA